MYNFSIEDDYEEPQELVLRAIGVIEETGEEYDVELLVNETEDGFIDLATKVLLLKRNMHVPTDLIPTQEFKNRGLLYLREIVPSGEMNRNNCKTITM